MPMGTSRSRPRKNSDVALLLGLLGVGVGVAAAVGLYVTNRKPRTRFSLLQWQQQHVNADGRVVDFREVARAVVQLGLDPDVRAHVWPYLLEVFLTHSTTQDLQRRRAELGRKYGELLQQCRELEEALAAATQQLRRPLAADADATSAPAAAVAAAGCEPAEGHDTAPRQLPPHLVQFAEAHRIIVIDAVRTDFSKSSELFPTAATAATANRGGNDDAAADELGGADVDANGHVSSRSSSSSIAVENRHAALVEPASSSTDGNDERRSAVASSFASANSSNNGSKSSITGEGATAWLSKAARGVLDAAQHLSPDVKRQDARLIALLSAYAVHDPETGYCQGMSDLAVPLLLLFDDDAVAFWCFEALMRRARCNFAVDEAGIFRQLTLLARLLQRTDMVLHHQLRQLGVAECHFAYRMIVVLMRRDPDLSDAMTMWEICWADAWLRAAAADSAVAPGPARAATPATEVVASADSASPTHAASNGEAAPACTDKAMAEAPRAGASESAEIPAATQADTAIASPAPLPPPSPSQHQEGDQQQQQQQQQPASSELVVDLFMWFVAAVVVSQKRKVLDECHDADDVLQLFHTLQVDFWHCLAKAFDMRERVHLDD